jgi:putative oxidoreductase
VLGILAESQPEVMSQLWIGGVIELGTGLMIATGFVTRWAAFLASGTMAVAYFQFHWKAQFDSNFFPAINRGESAVVYCFLFLFIACKGAGVWSVDNRRR